MPENYRVLARKYRPSTFEDLIGQEPMVRTLSNAFAAGRIHQAYLLTGVRGIGKTTTARILARAFNYETESCHAPTILMPVLGKHCQAIMESRHVDVLEMDAASHTGIDDVREIIENARYRPISARFKVYIIDEVHMLSKAAFNGLLKTLEEPPEHVKFLFATTEIDKVPITVRSRCLRFDLKRIDDERLVAHLENICRLEGVSAEKEALALIAYCAEGSVRNSLSLLDQAIAHGGTNGVRAADLRDMLGMADRRDIVALFRLAMSGQTAQALEATQSLYSAGVDPGDVLLGLSGLCHFVTRVKLNATALQDPSLGSVEKEAAAEMAQNLSMGSLSRAWALIMSGYEDVKDSPRPLASLDMALIKLAYASDLPGPEEALRKLLPKAGHGAEIPVLEKPVSRILEQKPSVSGLQTFEDLIALARTKRDVLILRALEHDMRIASFEAGHIVFTPTSSADPQLASVLTKKLLDWTGERWVVSVTQGVATPTLQEERQAKIAQQKDDAATHPVVRRVVDVFPDAQIIAVRGAEPVFFSQDIDMVYTDPDDDV